MTNLFKLCPLVGVLLIALVLPASLALSKYGPTEGPVIVIAAPWDKASRIAGAVGGQMIAPGRIGAIGLVWADHPQLADTLYRNGAWWVLNGDLSGALCVT